MSGIATFRPGDVFADFFVVERALKAGGMGAVYVVRHRETGKRQALKVMHPDIVASPEARARFRQEAQIASMIDAPRHIVDVHHAGIDAATGIPFIVMELLSGVELGDLLQERGRLPQAEALGYLRQVARALDRAHAKGVVHRDLKPQNLFLVERDDEEPTIKILDFGIAKIVQGASASATSAGGTPHYMAPEQTSVGAHISPATDVWALGLIAYTLLVGDPIWRGADISQIFREILIDELPSPLARAAERGVTLPAAFDAWLLRCLRRDPHERFQRAGEAIAALEVALGSSAPPPAVTPLATARPSIAPSSRPRTALWVAAGLGVVLAAAATVYVATRPSRVGPPRSPETPVAPPPGVDENPFLPVGGLRVQAHEVTRAEYRRYLDRLVLGERSAALPLDDADLADRGDLPITWITFEQASAYCAALHAALPTSAEWTRALGGATFPDFTGVAVANAGATSPVAVESSSGDITPEGVHDLAGNVQEWTSTVSSGLATVRGGAIAMTARDARKAIVEGLSKFTATSAGSNARKEAIAGGSVGFRCVQRD